jgi:hypothetical protein
MAPLQLSMTQWRLWRLWRLQEKSRGDQGRQAPERVHSRCRWSTILAMGGWGGCGGCWSARICTRRNTPMTTPGFGVMSLV